MREWASRELRGYVGSGLDLPAYREPSAIIQIDWATINARITGQQISPRSLPDVVAEHVGETVPLGQPIAEIEEMLSRAKADGGHIRLTLPGSQDVVSLMNHELVDRYDRITAVYWSLSQPALQGVIDQVRTSLVEIVAEIRAGMSDSADTPSADVADRAVSVAVYGRGARVSVNSAQASGSGLNQLVVAPAARERRHPIFTVGAALVGLATVAGTVVGVLQWQGWGF